MNNLKLAAEIVNSKDLSIKNPLIKLLETVLNGYTDGFIFDEQDKIKTLSRLNILLKYDLEEISAAHKELNEK